MPYLTIHSMPARDFLDQPVGGAADVRKTNEGAKVDAENRRRDERDRNEGAPVADHGKMPAFNFRTQTVRFIATFPRRITCFRTRLLPQRLGTRASPPAENWKGLTLAPIGRYPMIIGSRRPGYNSFLRPQTNIP